MQRLRIHFEDSKAELLIVEILASPPTTNTFCCALGMIDFRSGDFFFTFLYPMSPKQRSIIYEKQAHRTEACVGVE